MLTLLPALWRRSCRLLLLAVALPAAAEACNPQPEPAPDPEDSLPMLTLRDWRAAGSQRPQAFLLADAAQVLALAQSDLRRQGETFGRMVAFMEKAGLPRTRVPGQPELLQWLQREHLRIETLTLGNNLEASRLARFYNLAHWQGEPLTCAESGLLDQLLRWRVLASTDHGYVPGTGPDMVITFPLASELAGCESCRVDEAESLAILMHELQHARYFLDPALQHYTEWYWFNRLPLLQRLRVMRLLERLGYDTSQLALLLDEFHAFLAQGQGGLSSRTLGLDQELDVFRQQRQDFFNGMAAFEAGKGPTARSPDILQPSIQGE